MDEDIYEEGSLLGCLNCFSLTENDVCEYCGSDDLIAIETALAIVADVIELDQLGMLPEDEGVLH